MKHLGDITKIKGCNAPVVDCIIGGSPCQDLSVAGKRAGLAGERSGLYIEQIRIIKEMRHKDEQRGRTGESIRPRYMVWENVPGAFSSNKGKDFAAVIEEAIKVAAPEAPSVPVPEKGWPTSGCFMGDTWSVAWRVLDAQFWGTSDKPLPQRRRRIALVADFGGLSASEILFVRKSMSGNIEPGEQKRKETSGDVGEGTGGAIPCTLKIRGGCNGGGKGALIQEDKSATLSTLQDQTLFQPVFGIDQQGGKGGANYAVDVSPPILSDSHGTPHAVAYGIGSYHSNAWKSDNPNSGVYEAETAKTLDSLNCGYPGCNQGGMAVVQPVMSLQGSMIGRADQNGPQGDGVNEDVSFTLNTTDRHAVAYSIENHPADSRVDIDESGMVQTLTSRMGTGGGNVPMVMETVGRIRKADATYQRVTGPLMANSHPGSYTGQDAFSDMLVAGYAAGGYGNYTEGVGTLRASGGDYGGGTETLVRCKHIVRRLTPLECERLQGFPDGWTDIGEWVDSKGKKHKEADSPRYKALGNSIALPPWKWVLKRLCACYERDATMASLFDGIGGFPFIWEQINGKGSCLWASEIEEFPMAVTKLRFGNSTAGKAIQHKEASREDGYSLWIDKGGDFICPSCGDPSEYVSNYCPNCGKKLIFGGNNCD